MWGWACVYMSARVYVYVCVYEYVGVSECEWVWVCVSMPGKDRTAQWCMNRRDWFFFFFLLVGQVPGPETEPVLSRDKARSLTHFTTRELLVIVFYCEVSCGHSFYQIQFQGDGERCKILQCVDFSCSQFVWENAHRHFLSNKEKVLWIEYKNDNQYFKLIMKKLGAFPLGNSRVTLQLTWAFLSWSNSSTCLQSLCKPCAKCPNHWSKSRRQVPDTPLGKASLKRQQGRHLH